MARRYYTSNVLSPIPLILSTEEPRVFYFFGYQRGKRKDIVTLHTRARNHPIRLRCISFGIMPCQLSVRSFIFRASFSRLPLLRSSKLYWGYRTPFSYAVSYFQLRCFQKESVTLPKSFPPREYVAFVSMSFWLCSHLKEIKFAKLYTRYTRNESRA